jgi:serine/threonine protein kinase
VKGWAELKEAFWAAVDGGPEERVRQAERLAAIDPALPERLATLLNTADSRDDAIARLFDTPADAPSPPDWIGQYEVTGVLGVGGMGEVYRARDSRLQRDVAVKVLPAAVTKDPERLARLRREAQVLASLNHPHIAHVYGLEESSAVPALVMELVTGPTLAAVIAQQSGTGLAIRPALKIATQIADALDAAHEKGIVHRDLKPGNIVLTEDGDVKIVDFGLAKSIGLAPDAPAVSVAGVVLGTPAYMSPEQARGLPVDKRTDIWAFGCVLYELLTGRQAFDGNTASDILAAVLEREPDMTALPQSTPEGIRGVLRHCLEKDPRQRLRDIADARFATDDVLSGPRETSQAGRLSSVPFVWAAAAVAFAVAATMFASARLGKSPSVVQPQRAVASIPLPRGMRLADADVQTQGSESRFAISPDGRQLALVASEESGPVRIWLRALGSSAMQPLAHTEGASSPFWSPDSGSIAFVAGDRLKVIRLADGTVTTTNEKGFRAGAWGSGDRILFAPQPQSPLAVIPASGGALAPATTLDKDNGEVQHGSPAFLPDGRHFLFFSLGSKSGGMLDPVGIYAGSVDDPRERQLLLPGATVARYASGRLLFVKNGILMAQPFDAERRTLSGAPVPIVEDVKAPASGATGGANFTVSDNGVLAYQSGVKSESRPVWLDRDGQQLGAIGPPGDYGDVVLSPDGSRLAVSAVDPAASTRDLWVYDASGGGGRRVTFDPGDEFAPVWSPDGTRLLFSAMANGLVNLQMKEVMGTGDPVAVKVDSLGLGRFAADWSRDGRYLLYVAGGRIISRSDLWSAPVARPQDARPLVNSSFVETQVRLSPDGRWFAYTSNETGRFEVYVDRFPDRGMKRMISTTGGGWPRWSRDGRELFYIASDNHLVSVPITSAPGRFAAGAPRPLFALRPRLPDRLDAYAYDVSPDGRRFVVNTPLDDTAPATITVVFNWTSGLPGQ